MGFDVGGIALTSSAGALSVDGASNFMKVNASGILTRPQTPYFRGQLTGLSGNYNGGGGSMMVTADVNFGGYWNNATGYWICPVAGYYMVTGAGIASTQAGYFYVQRNGSSVAMTHWNHMSNWTYVSLSCVVYCSVADSLRYYMDGLTPGTNGFYGAGGHGMYSIALLA